MRRTNQVVLHALLLGGAWCVVGSCLISWAANVVYPVFLDLIVSSLGVEVVFLTLGVLVAAKLPLHPVLGMAIVSVAASGSSAYGVVGTVLMTTHVGESGYLISFIIASGLGASCCMLGAYCFKRACKDCWAMFRGGA